MAKFRIYFPINVNESLIAKDIPININTVYSNLKVLTNYFAILISIIKNIVHKRGTK